MRLTLLMKKQFITLVTENYDDFKLKKKIHFCLLVGKF